MSLSGRCMCGDISYAISETPTMMGVCHCKHCQRQAGSAFSMMASVPEREFKIERGQLTTYENVTDSGNTAQTMFCGRCGSSICTVLKNQPGVVMLKAGTLDDTSWFQPQYHVWSQDKQGWVVLEEDGAHNPTGRMSVRGSMPGTGKP